MTDNLPANELDVKAALQAIIDAADSTSAVNYAYTYAKAGKSMTGHALYVQVLYTLNNITHWRGPNATAVRNVLKRYIKEYNNRR